MKIDIITLFPDIFKDVFNESIIKRAQQKNLIKINTHNLRKWAVDKHKTVDDKPFGGGPGMILKVDVLYNAIEKLTGKGAINRVQKNIKVWKKEKHRVVLLDPAGKTFNQKKAKELSKLDYLMLICGHYEGVDQRVKEHLVDEAISIGDYVLTGGEIPAMVLVDATVRLIPGVLKKSEAVSDESFQPSTSRNKGLVLEYPQYTRPPEFLGWKVPEILLSGNHKEIEKWKRKKAAEITKEKRPDLIKDLKKES
jgi:tRNA (guanine37-N1)-methyltransferase